MVCGMGGGTPKNFKQQGQMGKIEDSEYFDDLFAKIAKNQEEMLNDPNSMKMRRSVGQKTQKKDSLRQIHSRSNRASLRNKNSVFSKAGSKTRDLTSHLTTKTNDLSGKTLFGMMREDFRDPFENAKETRFLYNRLGIVNFVAFS